MKSDDYRNFSASLLQGLNSDGNPASGVALDIRPYLVVAGGTSSLQDYRNSKFVQVLSSAQISYATTSSDEGSTEADRFAIGLNAKLWRQNDPMLGTSALSYINPTGNKTDGTLDTCYRDFLLDAVKLPIELPEDLEKWEEEIATNARKSIDNCLNPFKKKYWNSGSVDLGLLGTRTNTDTSTDTGAGIWLGASYGIGEKSQIVFSTSHEDGKQLTTGNSTDLLEADETNIGFRFKFGSERGTFMLEALSTRIDSATDDESFARANLGVEIMLARDIWIQLAFGKAFSTDRFDDDVNFSSQVRFGFSENSILPIN